MYRGVLVEDKLFFNRKVKSKTLYAQKRSWFSRKKSILIQDSETMATQFVQPSDVAGLSPKYAELAINAERLMSTLEESCTWGK